MNGDQSLANVRQTPAVLQAFGSAAEPKNRINNLNELAEPAAGALGHHIRLFALFDHLVGLEQGPSNPVELGWSSPVRSPTNCGM